MRSRFIQRAASLLAATALSATALTASASPASVAALSRLAPDLEPSVLQLAMNALQCAGDNGMAASSRLAVIDYSKASSEPRLWVFDLERQRLLFRELVAHGRNSGDNYTRHFSNQKDSLATSLGLFRTGETYVGSNGYSLRLQGLDAGFNDRAEERAIVMHGAPYVNEQVVQKLGRLGRSWGCPAVRSGIARQMIDTLKQGHFVFSYYPDPEWLASSRLLNCRAPATLAALGRSGRNDQAYRVE